MSKLWSSAVALLIITGGLLGLTLPFGKIGSAAGVAPAVWALVVSGGSGLLLLAAFLLRGGRMKLTVHKARYFLVAAVISFVIPNLLMFSVIPHLGAGYTGIMFTLSPVVTLVLSLLFGVRRPNALGIAGIAVGFVGALLVAVTRGEAGQPAALLWVVLGLLIPVALALGNIYRSYDWPEGTGPIELAVGSNLTSALILLLIIIVTGQAGEIAGLAEVPMVAVAQMISAASMFAFFFRLQSVGGPVYLSQIGYVGAAVGLVSGMLFLGEHYRLLTWIGALVIVAGVLMTSKAQKDREA